MTMINPEKFDFKKNYLLLNEIKNHLLASS